MDEGEPIAGPLGGSVTKAYGKVERDSPLSRFLIRRRALQPTDMLIDIAYCGICHTDLHFLADDWNMSVYPQVPGHEISGYVREVGSDVKDFRHGQPAAVGCIVESCGKCCYCQRMIEQYCDAGVVLTYNGASARDGGANTLGGFSGQIVVNEHFVVPVPNGYPLDKVGCLLCAGITVYSPLRRCKVSSESKVGVAGLGGVGHMAVKLAVAMGAEVWVISRNDKKRDVAMKLGAKGFIDCSNPEQSFDDEKFDVILDTISVKHDIDRLISMLRNGGILCLLGLPKDRIEFASMALTLKGKSIMGSCIGSLAEAKELLRFCSENHIYADTTPISVDEIGDALEKLKNGDVSDRFVVKMDTL